MRWQCSLFVAALAAAAPASPLSAQAAADASVAGTELRTAAPSVAERLALPPHAAELLVPAPAMDSGAGITAIAMQRTGRGTALAVVGGALFVGGLIAGGDAGTLMVVAGAGIGAYGLYLMLR